MIRSIAVDVARDYDDGELRQGRQGDRQAPLRALRDDAAGALRDRARHRHPHVRRARRPARQRPRLRDLQAGRGVDLRLADRGYILDGEQASPAGHQRPLPGQHPARRHLLGRAARAGRRDHPGTADRHRRGRPATSTSTRRSPAASASTCSAPGSSSCRRSGRGCVDAGFESGHAYGKALRTVKSCVGIDVVPLRRAGLGADGHRPRAALPRPARAAQDQVRPCRAAPASAPRRRARTSASSPPSRAGTSTSAATAALRPAHAELLAEDLDDATLVRTHRPLPHVVRPHGRAPGAHGDVAAQAARRDRLRAPRRASTTSSASAPSSRPTWPATSRATRASGRRRSTTRSGSRRFVSFVNAPMSPTRPSPTSRCAVSANPRRADAAAMSILDHASALVAVCPVERLTPNRGVAALVDGRAVAIFLLRGGEIHAIDNVDPCTGASVLSRGLVGDADGVADRGVAAPQAALRPAHRPLPRRRGPEDRRPRGAGRRRHRPLRVLAVTSVLLPIPTRSTQARRASARHARPRCRRALPVRVRDGRVHRLPLVRGRLRRAERPRRPGRCGGASARSKAATTRRRGGSTSRCRATTASTRRA